VTSRRTTGLRPASAARALGCFALALGACRPARPPASTFPTGGDALDRLQATYRCERGVHGEAKVEHFSEHGRVRGSLLLYAARPEGLRLDVLAPPPFQSVVATLASDGRRFGIADVREKRYFEGPASACAIGRFTGVEIPGHALATLLNGQAPLLVHQRADVDVRWDGGGFYLVRVPSTRDAVEEIRLAPTPADFDKPWSEQRVRVLDVRVRQRGGEVWHASLDDFAPAKMGAPLVDPEGIDPPVPPSGPPCEVELPRKIEVEVPGTDQSLRLRYESLTVNPPLPEGVFDPPPSEGLPRVPIVCE
jgi:hypothetical protein